MLRLCWRHFLPKHPKSALPMLPMLCMPIASQGAAQELGGKRCGLPPPRRTRRPKRRHWHWHFGRQWRRRSAFPAGSGSGRTGMQWGWERCGRFQKINRNRCPEGFEKKCWAAGNFSELSFGHQRPLRIKCRPIAPCCERPAGGAGAASPKCQQWRPPQAKQP